MCKVNVSIDIPELNNAEKKDLIKLDFSGLTGSFTRGQQEISFGQKIKKLLSSKSGKIALGVTGTIAIAGAGYGLYKKQQEKTASENSSKHLSAVI